MDNMTITNSQYITDMDGNKDHIKATIDGQEWTIPLDLGNTYYIGIIAATSKDGSFWGDSVPEPMATLATEYQFNQQLADYKTATARLAQYIVSVGRTEVVESQPTGEQVWDEDAEEMVDVMHDVITVTAVEPVEATVTRTVYSDDMDAEPVEETIENPVITVDVSERADAQAVVAGTPEAVVAAAV